MQQHTLTIQTNNRKAIEITSQINALLTTQTITQGLCHLFVKHTSAGLMITANEDPNILLDIENYLQNIVPDKNKQYHHNNYPMDMPGHLRSLLLGVEKTIPMTDKQLNLGKLQGIFLYEFSQSNHARTIIVTIHE